MRKKTGDHQVLGNVIEAHQSLRFLGHLSWFDYHYLFEALSDSSERCSFYSDLFAPLHVPTMQINNRLIPRHFVYITSSEGKQVLH